MMEKQFLKMLDDGCPTCEAQRNRAIKLRAEARGVTVYIVCPECGFAMTDAEYSTAKASGRL